MALSGAVLSACASLGSSSTDLPATPLPAAWSTAATGTAPALAGGNA
jgi:hypothetical protein